MLSSMGRRLLAIFLIAFTFMCAVQVVTDFLDTPPTFDMNNLKQLNAVMSAIKATSATAKPSSTTARKMATREKSSLLSIEGNNKTFQSLLNLRRVSLRTKTVPPPSLQFSRPPRRPLKPGEKLRQDVYWLSNGTAVGWLPRYDREHFPLLHASPACNKHDDVYVAFVVSAGKNFARRQVC